jgi:hypothetical protein
MAAPHPRFFLLVYRIQPRPTTHRVAVWRQNPVRPGGASRTEVGAAAAEA